MSSTQNTDSYPGIGRLAYIGGHIAIIIFLAFYSGFLVKSSADQAFMPGAVKIMAGAGSLALTITRLQNLGKNMWWLLYWFFPLANLYVIFLCGAAPPGYEQNKRFDTAGGAIVAAMAALITTFIVLLIFG